MPMRLNTGGFQFPDTPNASSRFSFPPLGWCFNIFDDVAAYERRRASTLVGAVFGDVAAQILLMPVPASPRLP